MSASDVAAGALCARPSKAAAVAPREVPAWVGVQHSVVPAHEGRGREPPLPSPVAACGVTLEVHLGHELPTSGRPGPVGPVGRRLSRRRAAVLATAAPHGMTDLRVFGSVARGQDTDDSDLKLLVRVRECTGLLALGRFTQELEDLLHVPVDVVPDDSVKPRVRDSILSDLAPL